jgi:hypothetical protein
MRPEEIRKGETEKRLDTSRRDKTMLALEFPSVSVNQLGRRNDEFACGLRQGYDGR